MNRLSRYWWNLKTAVGLLGKLIGWFVVLAAMSGLLLGAVDAPDLLGGLVGLGLILGFLWTATRTVRTRLPVSEAELEERRAADTAGRGGVDVMRYACDGCGKLLYDDWDISASSAGYACRNCGYVLDDQQRAGTVHAFGGDEQDDEGGDSAAAPWDEEYGDPAPWDEEYGDPAPWDDDYVDKPWDDHLDTGWDDDDEWW
jgi:DNA-directed RNA polymerase subunit RPC12/RpoP